MMANHAIPQPLNFAKYVRHEMNASENPRPQLVSLLGPLAIKPSSSSSHSPVCGAIDIGSASVVAALDVLPTFRLDLDAVS